MMRRLLTVTALTLAWCGLWRELSVANVASGLVVATVVSSPIVATVGRGGVRPLPLLRLIMLVLRDLVSSTLHVAREIVTPTDYTDEIVVAVPLPPTGDRHLLLLTVAITLTPGTAVLDINDNRDDPEHNSTLYLHLLHKDTRKGTVEHVLSLAALACDALPVDEKTWVAR